MAKAAVYRADRFIDPVGLLNVVTVLVIIGMVFDVMSLLSSIMQYELLTRMFRGDAWTQEEAQNNDIRELAIVGLSVLWAIVMAVPFLKLIGRLNHNAWSFGAKGMQYTPGWSVGWFFVPIANLFVPFKVVTEIWQVSSKGETSWSSRATSPLIPTWWGLWISSNVLSRVSAQVSMGETLEMLQFATLLDMVTLLLHLGCAVAALLMLKQLVSLQVEREESGARYDRPAYICPACGEPVAVPIGNCPMCGADLESLTDDQQDDFIPA